MPLRLSTGLRNALNSEKVAEVAAVTAAETIAFVDSGNKITDSANGFVTAGLKAGDKILISGAAAANNNGVFLVDSVAVGEIELDGDAITDAAAGATVTITVLKGGAWKDVLRDGVIRIFSGSQPTSADDGEIGTQLLEISISSGTFTPASPVNGLNFGDSVAGVINKSSSEIWSGVGLVNGTAGWFRFYSNARTTGSSAVAVRFDGACATSGGQLNMSSTSIVSGATTTIDSFNVTLPASST